MEIQTKRVIRGTRVAFARLQEPAGTPIISIDSVARVIRIGGTDAGPTTSERMLGGAAHGLK